MNVFPSRLPHYEPSHEYDRRKKQEQAKRTIQHQLASFTEIQGTSSTVTAKTTAGPKPHRIPPSNSKPPAAFPNENPFPSDQFKPAIVPPIPGNRMAVDSGPPAQFNRGGPTHAGNPYSSQGSSRMMTNNDGRGDAENRQHYPNSSRRMRPEPNRGGGMPSHPPYPVPPPNLPGGQIPSIGGSGPSIAAYGHASLPSRPVSSFDRGPYDPMRLPKAGPPMAKMGGMNGAPIGAMPAGPPYPHPHSLPGHPEPYSLGPPPPLLSDHGPGDDRGQRGEPYPKIPHAYPPPLSGGPPMRDAYVGGPGHRGRGGDGGRADGRLRSNHDRWTPEPISQLGGPLPPGLPPYPNGRAGGDRRQGRGSERRFRHGGGGPPGVSGPHEGRDSYQYPSPAHNRNPNNQFFSPPNGAGGAAGVPNPYATYTYPPGEPMAASNNLHNPFPHPPNNTNNHQNGHPNQRWDNKSPSKLDFRPPPHANNNPYAHHHHHPITNPNSPPNHLSHHPPPPPPPSHLHLPNAPGPTFSDEPRLEY